MRLCRRELGRALLDLLDRDLPEQRHRVVPGFPPQGRIELPEQIRRVVVPAPPEVLRERGEALMRRRDDQTERAGFADDRRQLRARHHQHPHVVLGEGARLDRLDDQHALEEPAVDQRDAEKRVVRIFAGLAEVLEARMAGGVGDDLRLHLLGDEAGQALRSAACGFCRRSRDATRSWRRAPGSSDRAPAGTPSRRRYRTGGG